MSRIKYNDDYSYEIYDDGYDIFADDMVVITQRGAFSKPYDSSKSYEENCILQLDDMTKEPSPPVDPQPTPEEINRADIDFIALMEDLVLPSKELLPEEEGE